MAGLSIYSGPNNYRACSPEEAGDANQPRQYFYMSRYNCNGQSEGNPYSETCYRSYIKNQFDTPSQIELVGSQTGGTYAGCRTEPNTSEEQDLIRQYFEPELKDPLALPGQCTPENVEGLGDPHFNASGPLWSHIYSVEDSGRGGVPATYSLYEYEYSFACNRAQGDIYQEAQGNPSIIDVPGMILQNSFVDTNFDCMQAVRNAFGFERTGPTVAIERCKGSDLNKFGGSEYYNTCVNNVFVDYGRNMVSVQYYSYDAGTPRQYNAPGIYGATRSLDVERAPSFVAVNGGPPS